MSKYILKAEPRLLSGRKVKRLRNEGILPGNVYGKDVKSVAVSLSSKDFGRVYKDAGETNIIELDLGKEKKPTLIHNVQKDPVEDEFIHVDFLQVNLKVKVSANIPVELVGESPVEKRNEGIVVQYIDELEVEALPTDLPEKFEIDIARFEKVDDQITVSEIKYDKSKISIKEEADKVIVRVEELTKEEPEAPVAGPEAEGGEALETEAKEDEETFPEEKTS